MVDIAVDINVNILSLPAWGEWIEIECPYIFIGKVEGLSPHGESGLKFQRQRIILSYGHVSPRMGRVD